MLLSPKESTFIMDNQNENYIDAGGLVIAFDAATFLFEKLLAALPDAS